MLSSSTETSNPNPCPVPLLADAFPRDGMLSSSSWKMLKDSFFGIRLFFGAGGGASRSSSKKTWNPSPESGVKGFEEWFLEVFALGPGFSHDRGRLNMERISWRHSLVLMVWSTKPWWPTASMLLALGSAPSLINCSAYFLMATVSSPFETTDARVPPPPPPICVTGIEQANAGGSSNWELPRVRRVGGLLGGGGIILPAIDSSEVFIREFRLTLSDWNMLRDFSIILAFSAEFLGDDAGFHWCCCCCGDTFHLSSLASSKLVSCPSSLLL